MRVYPTQLALREGRHLQITWSDGQKRAYTAQQLRAACPCATCRERRLHPPPSTELPVLSAAEAQPLTIRDMQPVGSYAYSIVFSDGHSTGIYTLEHLRELGAEVE
jgi:DUF971 family protein